MKTRKFSLKGMLKASRIGLLLALISIILGGQIAESATLGTSSDFIIQRGSELIPTTSTTYTITAGSDYTAPTGESFVRIINTRHVGMGNTAGDNTQPLDDWTFYIDQSSIGTSISFVRSGVGEDCRIDWEIIEYIGLAGGGNEFKVLETGTVTFTSTALTATTGYISAYSTNVVPFVTACYTTSTTTDNLESLLATSDWSNGYATFRRGAVQNTFTIKVSYAVVDFNGANWKVQRAEHTYTAAGVEETETITALAATSQAFLHTQHRGDTGQQGLDEAGDECYIASTTSVGFSIWSTATTPGAVHTVAWVIENTITTTTGRRALAATHFSGTRGKNVGSEEDLWTEDITSAGVSILGETSLIGENAACSGKGTWYPRGSINMQITSSTVVTLRRSDIREAQAYRFSIVEWPVDCTTFYDYCGVCNGDNSTCLGCDGVPGSGAIYDFCGVCDGDGSSCPPSPTPTVTSSPTVSPTPNTDPCYAEGIVVYDLIGSLDSPNYPSNYPNSVMCT